MNCRLCLQSRELCDSHIIPEFLYRPLYGPTHQVRSIHPGISWIRFPRKGLRERLLCIKCEGLISQYEHHFARVWHGESGLPTLVPDGATEVRMAGLDYATFKLFHLSILWRAGVSTLTEFANIKLGPHEERLRQMILARDPGPASRYRLAASVLLRPALREVHGGVISVPQRQRHDGRSFYSSIYAGCIWHCFIGEGMSLELGVLTEDGSLTMAVIDIREIRAVAAALARASTARRKRNIGGGAA